VSFTICLYHCGSLSSVRCSHLLLLGLRGLATEVVANTALVAKLALAEAVVFMGKTAAFLELAVTLEVETAHGAALPFALRFKGAANEGLLPAGTHPKSTTSTTAKALLHEHGVHLHALLVHAVPTAAAEALTGNPLESTTTATTRHCALTRELAVETSSSVVLLGIDGIGAVDLLHEVVKKLSCCFFAFSFPILPSALRKHSKKEKERNLRSA
jgi:hypothetical protein